MGITQDHKLEEFVQIVTRCSGPAALQTTHLSGNLGTYSRGRTAKFLNGLCFISSDYDTAESVRLEFAP